LPLLAVPVPLPDEGSLGKWRRTKALEYVHEVPSRGSVGGTDEERLSGKSEVVKRRALELCGSPLQTHFHRRLGKWRVPQLRGALVLALFLFVSLFVYSFLLLW